MLLKVQPKLVIVSIFISFLAIECKGSGGYSEIVEEPYEDVHGGTTQPAEGDLEKELIKLMKEKIEYFGTIKNTLEAKVRVENYGDVRDDLNASYNVYKICKDVKRYFQKKGKDAKRICTKEFIESWEKFVRDTRLKDSFKKPQVTNVYNKEDVIKMINDLNSHTVIGSSEVNYEDPVFAAETTATSSGYMPMTEYHEKKKGLSFGAIAKLAKGAKKWANKIKGGKSSGSGEKGKTIHLGRN